MDKLEVGYTYYFNNFLIVIFFIIFIMRSNLNKNQHSVYVLTLSFGVGLLNIVEK